MKRRGPPKRTRWTAEQLRLLRRHYPDRTAAEVAQICGRSVSSVHNRAHKERLGKSPAFLAQMAEANRERALRDMRIAGSFFRKGLVPWNKGLKGYDPGGRSHLTRFVKGQGTCRWRPEDYPIGALRINSDGVIDIKFRDPPRAWMPLARWNWQQAKGSLPPPGVVLRHRDGDTHNCEVENLEPITCAENMRRNSVHRLPKPLALAIQLSGALKRKINRMAKEEQQQCTRSTT